MSTVKIRNINPLGYVDLPLIGRVGPAPYLVCDTPDDCHPEHEHTEIEDKEHGKPGTGCLIPGEVFEVSDVPVDALDGRSVADVLLAQVGNYELVPAAKKTPSKRAAKKTAPKAVAVDPATTDTKDA